MKMKQGWIALLMAAGLVVGCDKAADEPMSPEDTHDHADHEGHDHDHDHDGASMTDKISDMAEDAGDKAGDMVDATKDAAGDAMEVTKEKTGEAVEATKEVAGDAMDATKEMAGDAVEGVKDVTKEMMGEDKPEMPEAETPEVEETPSPEASEAGDAPEAAAGLTLGSLTEGMSLSAEQTEAVIGKVKELIGEKNYDTAAQWISKLENVEVPEQYAGQVESLKSLLDKAKGASGMLEGLGK